MKSEAIIKEYLSSIGRRGGKKSRRTLSSESAKKMVLVREARRAFKKFYAECFWSYDPNFKVGSEDVIWVGRELMKHGSRECWLLGKKLCQ